MLRAEAKRRHRADVALFYPIRAVWEGFSPTAKDFRATVGRDPRYERARAVSSAFAALGRALLRNHVPFDVVDEAALLSAEARAEPEGTAVLRCGAAGARYRAVLLPAGAVLTPEVQSSLLRWVDAGGAVVAAGSVRAAAGDGCLAPRLAAAVQRVPSGVEALCARLRATGSAVPRLRALGGDPSAVLAAPFRHVDGRRGLMLANTADRPVRVAVGSPVSARWLRADLATGRVRLPRPPRTEPGRYDGGRAVRLAAYGAVWLAMRAETERG